MIVAFEIDADRWAEVLVRTGFLDFNMADDRMALSVAMKSFTDAILNERHEEN